ncbi:proton-coupled folate transporter-like [Daphnia carinata]|uniref:proton-coupled folate transporter-like n=1 Tax=Daphnia carinata TaxID=120202 RepID=UPI002868A2ED|nr:proton-coupled folate transporter-like [Daphnia carinata]
MMAAYQKVVTWISVTFQKLHITIEPFGFLFVMATVIQSVPKQYMLSYKVCRSYYTFNPNFSDCYGSNGTHSVFTQIPLETLDYIESYASILNMYGSLIDHFLSALFILLFGPLSNQYGTKFLMVAPTTGQIISTLIVMANYFADSLSAEFLLFADMSIGVLGGRATFVMAVNTYIVDVTTEESRTLRLAIMAGVVAIAVQISSQLISAVVYNLGGYLAIWLSALGFYTLSLIYLFFFVRDSRGQPAKNRFARLIVIKSTSAKEAEQSIRESLSEKCNCGVILKNVRHWPVIVFNLRKGYERILIFCLMICFFLNLFSYAHYGVAYLYTRDNFSWDHSDYILYTASFSFVEILGTLLFLPLLSDYLRFSDVIIGILSSSGNVLSYLFIALAASSTIVYLSTLGRLLSLGIAVVIRSLLSKLVKADEISHIYSFVAVLESLVPLIALVSFDSLYKTTQGLFSATVFLVEMGIEIMLLMTFVGVLILLKKEKANSVRPASNYYLSPFRRPKK